MEDIDNKVDNVAGASGEQSANEYNDHKNEQQEAVVRSGQPLSAIKTPGQNGRAMFINATCSQSFTDSGSVDQIVLTPLTGVNGLIAPDAYAQMDGMIVIFDKTTANTTNAVTVNIGQTTGTLLGAKTINAATIGIIGQLMIRYNLSADYWELVQIKSMPETGYIQAETILVGTNLITKKPKIETEPVLGFRKLINYSTDYSNSLSGLTANTWYARVCKESDGEISDKTIASFDKLTPIFGNWDVSGLANNQLDMYLSLYDFDRKYCRAYDGTDYYRVFAVFKTNGTPDGIAEYQGNEFLFEVDNLPYSDAIIARETDQTATSGIEKIGFNVIKFDINSGWDNTNFRYTPKFSHSQLFSMILDILTSSISFTRQLIIKQNATNNISYNSYAPLAALVGYNLSTERVAKIPVSSFIEGFASLGGGTLDGTGINHIQIKGLK